MRGVRVESFAEIAAEFHARIARIAWATVATVGAGGAPRTRIELTGLRHRSSGLAPLIWRP
jgi:hypothetical protein